MPDETATLAVVVARLDDVRGDIKAMRAELTAHRAEMVARTEWELRNQHVDSRHRELGREIGDLRAEHRRDVAEVRAEAASRRAPWWSIVTAVAAIAALALTLIQSLGGT